MSSAPGTDARALYDRAVHAADAAERSGTDADQQAAWLAAEDFLDAFRALDAAERFALLPGFTASDDAGVAP